MLLFFPQERPTTTPARPTRHASTSSSHQQEIVLSNGDGSASRVLSPPPRFSQDKHTTLLFFPNLMLKHCLF